MLRKLAFVLVVLVFVLASAQPAGAVKYGEPDNGEHPYVGLLVFYDDAGDAQWRCTGTLISPTVVLTAAHCAELEAGARFYLEEDVQTLAGYPYSGGYTGTAYAYDEWQGGLYLPNTGDVGVVVLDEAIEGISEFPELAPVGFLDGLATARGRQKVTFEVVGYGLQSVKPHYSALRVRMKAEVQLINLRSALTDGYNIHVTSSPGQGTGGGGTCFGDSGGAIFWIDDETGVHYIVAVNSFVLNANCAGAGFGYRVDTADVQAWLGGFLD